MHCTRAQGKLFSPNDLDNLLNSNVNTILAGGLNAKNPIWYSKTINSSGKILQNHMEQHLYTITAPNIPTHFPVIRHQRPDVLDITLIKADNIQYSFQNISDLSSEHNPIILNITTQNNKQKPLVHNSILTNWKKFATQLHEVIPSQSKLLNRLKTGP